jgi:hypothetical protein
MLLLGTVLLWLESKAMVKGLVGASVNKASVFCKPLVVVTICGSLPLIIVMLRREDLMMLA